MLNEVIDNIFKFSVEFNPDGNDERHLGRRHIYKFGPKFNLGFDAFGSGKGISLSNCVVELDSDGNLDTFRAAVFADYFSPDHPKVLMGTYENIGWRTDFFRDIFSDVTGERQAQMRAIKTVKERTKKPFIETLRFLAKFVIERHVGGLDRGEEEARARERREREKLERRMAKLRDEIARLGDGTSLPEGRVLLKMIVSEAINRYLFENTRGILGEAHLYTGDIDRNGLHHVSVRWTDDGYAEWEAFVDNGWYTFRGTYDGVDCELDEVIVGHSGYGHQIDIDDEVVDWFNENLRDEIVSRIEDEGDYYDDEDFDDYEF